ncbi:hypothetical protein [Gordonia oryzae]|uniref:hypothetical protein n=1 Tax=Gordonia oryzae TaxID=2487349 RepID=UPI001FEA9C8E|nr:hypothetical protein [Gordonia oryzae]
MEVSEFGGTTPHVTSALLSATNTHLVLGFYLIGSGIVGLVAVELLRESLGSRATGSPPQVDTPAKTERTMPRPVNQRRR